MTEMAELKKITIEDVSKMPREDLINFLARLGIEGDIMFKKGRIDVLEVKVSLILREIGMPAHLPGHAYVRKAIMYAVKEPTIMKAVTEKLYPSVAKDFSSIPSRVEKGISYAIEVAWLRGDKNILSGYFGCTIDNSSGKPTNSEFIEIISNKIRLDLKK